MHLSALTGSVFVSHAAPLVLCTATAPQIVDVTSASNMTLGDGTASPTEGIVSGNDVRLRTTGGVIEPGGGKAAGVTDVSVRSNLVLLESAGGIGTSPTGAVKVATLAGGTLTAPTVNVVQTTDLSLGSAAGSGRDFTVNLLAPGSIVNVNGAVTNINAPKAVPSVFRGAPRLGDR